MDPIEIGEATTEEREWCARLMAASEPWITLRRGDGGLLMEFQDDGATGESARIRRTLASMRGRVAPLGGSAEMKRGDVGWVLRVRLPCDQLN